MTRRCCLVTWPVVTVAQFDLVGAIGGRLKPWCCFLPGGQLRWTLLPKERSAATEWIAAALLERSVAVTRIKFLQNGIGLEQIEACAACVAWRNGSSGGDAMEVFKRVFVSTPTGTTWCWCAGTTAPPCGQPSSKLSVRYFPTWTTISSKSPSTTTSWSREWRLLFRLARLYCCCARFALFVTNRSPRWDFTRKTCAFCVFLHSFALFFSLVHRIFGVFLNDTLEKMASLAVNVCFAAFFGERHFALFGLGQRHWPTFHRCHSLRCRMRGIGLRSLPKFYEVFRKTAKFTENLLF